MTTQYLRNCSLIVSNSSGAGTELGSLRVLFEIHRGDYQSPNTCDAKVYNLSDNTANTLMKPEFTQMQLQVGYGSDALSTIFKGSVVQIRKGREDQRNSYVAITAADGDEAYNFSALALTLRGSTPKDKIQAIIAAMVPANLGSPTGATGGQQVSQGYIPSALPQNVLPRGRTYFGLCRDELAAEAHN